VAEGGGLLNRYRVVKPYRGFESLRLRHLVADFVSPDLFAFFCDVPPRIQQRVPPTDLSNSFYACEIRVSEIAFDRISSVLTKS
jgi:hypothetical protein